MRHPIITATAAGIFGAVLGGAGVLVVVAPSEAPAAGVREQMALQPNARDARSERSRSTAQPTTGEVAGAAPLPGVAGASNDSREAVAAELSSLRATARAAREQLGDARRRIATLEKELARASPSGERPAHHEFDLGPQDWRQLAADNKIKYRLPCTGGAASAPSDDVLDELGLAPDDRDVLRQAFEHSLERQRSALLPLCAKALGDRGELASVVGVDSCRHILLSTASARSESDSLAAKKVATYMAGDGPVPDDANSLSEQTFLVLAQESKHFEDELAEAFGPEEAHRLVFSDRLCFSHSTHRFSSRDMRAPETSATPSAQP